MPEGYPGAAVGGGDVLDGETYSALDVPQQRAIVAFWTAPGEFLIRVTHPAFVQWLVPAGICFADPTAAGQSCAASHVLESLLLGACCLDPAVAGTAKDRSGETFVTPNTLAAALDALVDAGLDLALPVPLLADPSATLNILDARITALLGSHQAPNAVVIGDKQLIRCHTSSHEVPQLPDPGIAVGWADSIQLSELAGFDGRLGPAGDLRALAGRFLLRAWRHNANGQYQIVLQTIAAHVWQHPAYVSLPWEVAPQLAAQFIVRTSWPSQLRLRHHAFPGVLEDVQLRVDYGVQTDADTKRVMLARLPSLLRAFVHVGALLGDAPPAEALGLAERLIACTSDGASTAVSVSNFAALDTYLATRRTDVHRLREVPVPLRVYMIEDAHQSATLDAAAAPMVLSPDDGASADRTLSATRSTIGQMLTQPCRNGVSRPLDSAIESVGPGAISSLGTLPPARQTPAWAPAPAAPAPNKLNRPNMKQRKGNVGNPPGTPGRVPAAIGGNHAALGGDTQQAGGMKPGSLAGSCKMNGGDLNMTVAPGVHSSSTTDRKFIIHVGQFCEDNDIDQDAICWPFMAEVARVNSNHFKGGAGARRILDAVAIARCPHARDPAHWRTKHMLLSDTLMLELNTPTYFRSLSGTPRTQAEIGTNSRSAQRAQTRLRRVTPTSLLGGNHAKRPRPVSSSEQLAPRAANRPRHTGDVSHGDDSKADGSAAHGDGGSTHASHSLAQHDGGSLTTSLAQHARQRTNGTGEPRRGKQPFLRASPLLPARDGSTRSVAPSTARRSDRPPASGYDDAGLLTHAAACSSDGAAERPHTATCSHRAGPIDPTGSSDYSTVAAPHGSSPPAPTTAGEVPDTPSVHNAAPRATPLGTSRTPTTQTTCLMRQLPKLVGTHTNEPDCLSDEANLAETRWHPRQRARQPV